MITTDDLLLGAKDVGLRVNNLFQLHVAGEEMWQANVRAATDDEKCFEFGRGATPADALLAAYKAAGIKVVDE